MSAPLPTVRDLRRLWKPHKERLRTQHPNHPTAIRFHRSCSWLHQAEAMATAELLDAKLVHQWVAFNALYGVWDELQSCPAADLMSWRRFTNRVLQLDSDGELPNLLQEHKPLALCLLQDKYLDQFFWRDPSPGQARHAQRLGREALTWYIEGRWGLILDRVLERVYLVRCQLVHGAATYGGKLNRDSLRHATQFLALFLPTVLSVWANHGADEDWGPMCYPPQSAILPHKSNGARHQPSA